MKKFLLSLAIVSSVFAANAQGTKENPLSVEEFLKLDITEGAVTDCYVQGYIVGWIDGASIKDGSHFDNQATSQSNFILADSSSETDLAYCIPVALPFGDLRTALNLQTRPQNYGHEVILNGSCEKYFGVTGMKNTAWYQWVGDAPSSTEIIPEYATGTEAAPLSVADFLKQGKPVVAVADTWLEGYIVGYIPGMVFDGGVLGNTGTEEAPVIATNILVAGSLEPANLSECVPVQLPIGDIRSGLNLLDNPDNLGKKVVLCGSHEVFFNENGLKNVDTYIMDGVRVSTAAAKDDGVNNIAETIALADNTATTINYPMTVAFVNYSNVYACDAAGNFIQIYGKNSYEVNDIIPAGWNATYKLYNGVTPELLPVTTVPDASGKGKFSPKFVEGRDINTSLVNNVVIIPNVEFATATPNTKDNFQGVADGVELSFRNNYTKPGVEAGVWSVEVLVTIYQGNPSLYVIEYFDPSGVEEVTVAENVYGVKGGVVAPADARVFNLSGIETGTSNLPAGIYVVVCGSKAVKVAVK